MPKLRAVSLGNNLVISRGSHLYFEYFEVESASFRLIESFLNNIRNSDYVRVMIAT